MRFLLLTATNTLSHLAKSLALRDALRARGHEVHVTASAGRSEFLRRLGVPHEVLPDVVEADGGASPSFAWFRAERFEACVRAEAELLRRLRPDRALGIFRFTGAISARLAGVPYDALVCGCMTPACEEPLGFAPGEPGAAAQAEAIAFFRRSAARRAAPALARLGAPPVEDAWALLLGERTYLWDTPEFQPLRPDPSLVHVGPLGWSGWPIDARARERLAALPAPLALVSFGTGGGHAAVAARLSGALARMGFSVAVAGALPAQGGPGAPRIARFDLLPVEEALERAAVVACHGGQGIAFEALQHRVPIAVVPFQPEQAQNGRCLERLGCGVRLEHGAVALPGAQSAEAAFLARGEADIEARLAALCADPAGPARRAAAAERVGRSGGVAALVAGLERPA